MNFSAVSEPGYIRRRVRLQEGCLMRTTLKVLREYRVGATDGDLGVVEDVYFDDRGWDIRHLVVTTEPPQTRASVLVPFESVAVVDRESRILMLRVCNADAKVGRYAGLWQGGPCESPDVRSEPPSGLQPRAEGLSRGARPAGSRDRVDGTRSDESAPHLHSVKALRGYRLQATDGEAGRIEDVLLETESRKLWFFIIRARGVRTLILLRPEHIRSISVYDKKIYADIPRLGVAQGSKYDPYLLI
jgi:uncharacterized protein YrrD